MELKDFIRQILHSWIFILVCAFLGLATAFFFNQSQKTTFQASLLLYLRPEVVSGLQETNSQTDYYGQLRVGEFADNFIVTLLQPDVQKEIGSNFKLKKLAPQVIKLSVEGEKSEQVSTTALAVVEAIGGTNKKFIEKDHSFFQVEKLISNPSVEKIEPHKVLNVFVGLVLGVVFGILIVSAKNYFHPK
jgi:capsular polysaccharide biosynthesis protein